MSAVTPVLLVHGGAGSPPGGQIEDEPGHHEALRDALLAGYELLAGGAPALDAAEAAVQSLEDCALFNAGRGSVLTADGRVEMDAAVMDGRSQQAGACAGITCVRHPVALARAVMEKTPHVLLVGEGAERYAADAGLEIIENDWFVTERERERHARSAGPDAGATSGEGGGHRPDPADRHGTVGAVALDSAGHLAACTSTGGVRGQLPGRVGDTPVIGAGTWADARVAVSCTGTGEQFIVGVVGHELSARVRHANAPLATAAADALGARDGGLIAVAADGSAAMPFNTGLMYRGRAAGGSIQTLIWRDEERTDG